MLSTEILFRLHELVLVMEYGSSRIEVEGEVAARGSSRDRTASSIEGPLSQTTMRAEREVVRHTAIDCYVKRQHGRRAELGTAILQHCDAALNLDRRHEMRWGEEEGTHGFERSSLIAGA